MRSKSKGSSLQFFGNGHLHCVPWIVRSRYLQHHAASQGDRHSKSVGASVPSILGLLSREIVILVLVANLFAWPIACFGMNKWLGSFAYHIDMNLLIYLAAALAAVLVALVTVSAQTIKAAMTNPSNTLRYE